MHEMALASSGFTSTHGTTMILLETRKKLITYAVYDRTSKEELINIKLFEGVATKGHLARKDYHKKTCNMHRDRRQSKSQQNIFMRRDEISHTAVKLL
jgi:hypothetical protein